MPPFETLGSTLTRSATGQGVPPMFAFRDPDRTAFSITELA
jgi:hypothetical protein